MCPFILFVGVAFLTFEVMSWHALKDAPDISPVVSIPLGVTNYLIYRKRVSWNEARSICESTVGRLAVLPTIEEAVKLVAEIQSISTPFTDEYDHAVQKYEFGMDRRYWIGLTDLSQEGDWQWMDHGGKLNYDFWYANQPDHIGTSNLEHCVVLWNPGYNTGDNHTFNDEDCLHKQYFICEKAVRKIEPVPNAVLLATVPVSNPAAVPLATVPAPKPVAAPLETAPISDPAAVPLSTVPILNPAAAPLATVPAPTPAAVPLATVPIPNPAAVPLSTVPIPNSAAAPLATVPAPTPAAVPLETAPISDPAAVPLSTVPIPNPAAAPLATIPAPKPVAVPLVQIPIPDPIVVSLATIPVPKPPSVTLAPVPSPNSAAVPAVAGSQAGRGIKSVRSRIALLSINHAAKSRKTGNQIKVSRPNITISANQLRKPKLDWLI